MSIIENKQKLTKSTRKMLCESILSWFMINDLKMDSKMYVIASKQIEAVFNDDAVSIVNLN